MSGLRYENDNTAFDASPEDLNMAQIKRNSVSTVSPADMIVNDTKAVGHVNKAVVVKNAMKTYAGAVRPVLNNFNMQVDEGSIYSLLGSSGCGKTTILSCIVGLRKIDGGKINVFGARPGTKESGVPGRRVGYMPQDICLYPEFTIKEALQYFGIIYGLNSAEIEEKQDFLIKFLDLPQRDRTVGTLSGGQKRRVSFACALIHEPQLLILDEPTVGVDPLLRENIWNYLCELVSTQRTTVIITTHYIEEARQSNKVGLMRNGRLLTEKSPDALLREHQATLLEDIVLKLCKNDNMAIQNTARDNDVVAQAIDEISFQSKRRLSIAGNPNGPNHRKLEKSLSSMSVLSTTSRRSYYDRKQSVIANVQDELWMSGCRLKALIMRNTVLLMRNVKFLLFILALPCLQMINTCLTIGNDPTDLKIGVVNMDADCTNFTKSCEPEFLSCRYLDLLPKKTLTLLSFESEDLAVAEVKKGDLWGYISFPENYSMATYDRILSGGDPTNETLDGSLISFEMDMTSKQIAETIRTEFFFTYQKYVMDLFRVCDFDPRVGKIPLDFQEPVYGTVNTNFREFIAPSSILAILFFFPLISGAVSYISDKKNGTLDRTLVAGVQTVEILAAYFVTEGVVLLIQTVLIFIIMTLVFSITIHGPIFWAFVLSALIGFSGLSLGFMISTMCTEEVQAVLLALGTYFPNMLLAGMVWPLEGIPIFLQYVALLVPCNLACEAMRSMVTRGWGITHPKVWPGFASTIAWICVYWILTIIIHRTIAKK